MRALVVATMAILVGCVHGVGNMTSTPEKTQPTPTWRATEAIKTPTRIATPSIIEVTAMPEWQWDVIGVYTPTIVDMNVRECSQANDILCPVIGEVKRDEPVQFYAIVRIASSGDVWLCLDSSERDRKLLSQCGKMVVWWLDGIEYGKVTLKEPAG